MLKVSAYFWALLMAGTPIAQHSSIKGLVNAAFLSPAIPKAPTSGTKRTFVSPTFASTSLRSAGSSDDLEIQEECQPWQEPHELWHVERVPRITDWTGNMETFPNPLSQKEHIPTSWFVDEDAAIAAKVQVDAHETEIEHERGLKSEAFSVAGPRLEIVHDPSKSKAAIVTCGGLCPGLNTVVREVVMCLSRQYGISDVYGVPAGYRGFKEPENWHLLDEKAVSNLHNIGGSILGSSRGGHDTDAIVDSLVANNINLLFVVGGDGTVRGAAKIADEAQRRGLSLSVAVVPKTIDNDVPLLDRTFGFETAVDAARDAINVANVEAEGFPFGLGVVKVMGRNSGFIAMHSTLGSRVVDLCLVPEVNFELDGPGGIVEHLYERLLSHGKAVVVVAEGAGQELIAASAANGLEEKKDASGNVLLEDVGPWLCRELKKRLDPKLDSIAGTPQNIHGDKLTLKYVDPSYMVRGVPPNTADNVYCTQLAHNAVHGALAGMTSFLVGSVNARECYVPIDLVVNKRNVIDTAHQSLWEYVVFDTAQPSFDVNSDDRDEADVLISASGGVILATDE